MLTDVDCSPCKQSICQECCLNFHNFCKITDISVDFSKKHLSKINEDIIFAKSICRDKSNTIFRFFLWDRHQISFLTFCETHCIKHRDFTWFHGVQILWKDTISSSWNYVKLRCFSFTQFVAYPTLSAPCEDKKLKRNRFFVQKNLKTCRVKKRCFKFMFQNQNAFAYAKYTYYYENYSFYIYIALLFFNDTETEFNCAYQKYLLLKTKYPSV